MAMSKELRMSLQHRRREAGGWPRCWTRTCPFNDLIARIDQ